MMRAGTPGEAADQAVTSSAAASPETATHLQKFSVSYEFPVVFTSGLFAGQAARALLVVSLVAAVGLTIFYWPPAEHWWDIDVWWESEESREGMGMMIVTAALALTAAAVFSGRTKLAAGYR